MWCWISFFLKEGDLSAKDITPPHSNPPLMDLTRKVEVGIAPENIFFLQKFLFYPEKRNISDNFLSISFRFYASRFHQSAIPAYFFLAFLFFFGKLVIYWHDYLGFPRREVQCYRRFPILKITLILSLTRWSRTGFPHNILIFVISAGKHRQRFKTLFGSRLPLDSEDPPPNAASFFFIFIFVCMYYFCFPNLPPSVLVKKSVFWGGCLFGGHIH